MPHPLKRNSLLLSVFLIAHKQFRVHLSELNRTQVVAGSKCPVLGDVGSHAQPGAAWRGVLWTGAHLGRCKGVIS